LAQDFELKDLCSEYPLTFLCTRDFSIANVFRGMLSSIYAGDCGNWLPYNKVKSQLNVRMVPMCQEYVLELLGRLQKKLR